MRKISGTCFLCLLLGVLATFAETPLSPVAFPTPTPTPPLPSDLPIATPPAVTGPPAPLAPANRIPFQRLNSGDQRNPAVRPVQPFPNAQASYSGPEVLAWDGMNKEYNAKPGEVTANLTFSVTNVSKGEVTINWV